jgi:hypothetical protein
MSKPTRFDVTIGMPSPDRTMRFDSFTCLQNMMGYSRSKGLVIDDCYSSSADIAWQRNAFVEQTLMNDSAWLLQIDTDIVFPHWALKHLIERNCKVVGGCYFEKAKPHHPACRMIVDGNYEKIELEPGEDGLKKVSAVGAGFLLVHASVLRKIEPPWFAFGQYGRGVASKGEDYVFCEKAAAAGFEIYIDLDLMLGHTGPQTIGKSDYHLYRKLRQLVEESEKKIVTPEQGLYVPEGPTGTGRIIT